MADEYTVEQAMADAEAAVNGPGGWRDLFTVEKILRERAEAELKKARQEIAHLTEANTECCPHPNILPALGSEDWGLCASCGDGGFPLTERAAYGDVACSTCHDTGLVPVNVDGQTATRKDGSTYVLQGAFADAPCPDCEAGKETSP